VEAQHIVIEARSADPPPQPNASLLHRSPALILVVIAIVDIQRWADPDLWGHVAFGTAMLAHRHISLHDTYSYSAHWRVWLNHEWLSDVVLGAVYQWFGIIGLKLLKLACSATIVACLALGLAETQAAPTAQIAIVLGVGVTIGPQMQFRPQMFTFALMSALIAILARYTYRGYARVWLAIPIMALWANLHGGFIAGLATLGTFSVIVVIQDWLAGTGLGRGVQLLVVLGLSTVATLATPYGYGTWQAVVHAIANPRTRQIINDWQPLLRAVAAMWRRNHIGAIPMLLGLAMFAAFAVGFALAPRRDDLPIVAVAAVMIGAAFLAMRNLPLAAIACAIPLAHHASLLLRPSAMPTSHNWLSQGLVTVTAIGLLVASGLFAPSLRAGSPKPVGVIAFMQEAGLSGNILNDFGWGEYLIWHMTPISRVFIDGRYDTIYPPEVIDDYLSFVSGSARAKGVLEKYPHDFVLLGPDDEAALALMASDARWKRLYRDGTCVLFARADSDAAQIPPVDVPFDETPLSDFP